MLCQVATPGRLLPITIPLHDKLLQAQSSRSLGESFSYLKDCNRPRLCENSNSKTQSGKSKPIHG